MHLVQDGVGHIGKQRRRHRAPLPFLHRGRNLTGGQAPRIQRADFLSEAVEPSLAFFPYLGVDSAVPITGHVDVTLRGRSLARLLPFAIAAMARSTPGPGMGRLPAGFGQRGLQRTLDEPFGQLREQARLAQALLGGGIILEACLEQGVVFRCVSGHRCLLRLVSE